MATVTMRASTQKNGRSITAKPQHNQGNMPNQQRSKIPLFCCLMGTSNHVASLKVTVAFLQAVIQDDISMQHCSRLFLYSN